MNIDFNIRYEDSILYELRSKLSNNARNGIIEQTMGNTQTLVDRNIGFIVGASITTVENHLKRHIIRFRWIQSDSDKFRKFIDPDPTLAQLENAWKLL